MIRIYGASDDLVEIEQDGKPIEELGAIDRERVIHIGEYTHVFARHHGKRGWMLGVWFGTDDFDQCIQPWRIHVETEKYSPVIVIECPACTKVTWDGDE